MSAYLLLLSAVLFFHLILLFLLLLLWLSVGLDFDPVRRVRERRVLDKLCRMLMSQQGTGKSVITSEGIYSPGWAICELSFSDQISLQCERDLLLIN